MLCNKPILVAFPLPPTMQGVAGILSAMVPCLRLYAFLACQLSRGYPFADHEYTGALLPSVRQGIVALLDDVTELVWMFAHDGACQLSRGCPFADHEYTGALFPSVCKEPLLCLMMSLS